MEKIKEVWPSLSPLLSTHSFF
jgi:hypothetical protein